MKGFLFGMAMVVALVAIYMSENRIRSSLYKDYIADKFRLTYFDGMGKAQQIRFALDYLGVDYED